ncbi:MAG: amino acid ABC transporter ATP-binding protein [Mycobacterium sp.]
MTTPAVNIRGLSKSFGAHTVFSDVSFETAVGHVTAIIGPSGSGKSTLLRCINRLDTPDAGSVDIGSRHYPSGTELRRAQRTELNRLVGMVFQSFNLFPHLTALQNVALAQRRVLGRSAEAAEDYALRLLDSVGLATKAASRPSTLSGGQQQRVAIARALALDPEVLLFDEPTSALDPELAQEVLGVMRDLADQGRTMVVVTHEMRFARGVADQIAVMADGSLIEKGSPAAVFEDPSHERTRRFLHAVADR